MQLCQIRISVRWNNWEDILPGALVLERGGSVKGKWQCDKVLQYSVLHTCGYVYNGHTVI